MKRKRGEATRRIIARLENGPAFPKQLSEELDLAESTVKYNLSNILRNQGIIQKLPDGKYAVKWWKSEGYDIKTSYELLKRKLLRTPKPEEIAGIITETPSKTRDLLFKYIPGYSEPTEREELEASKKLWLIISLGINFPTKDQLLKDRIGLIIADRADMQSIEQLTCDKSESKARYVIEGKKYLEEFPDMAPVIHQRKDPPMLYLDFEWQGLAASIFKKLPEYYIESEYYLEEKNVMKSKDHNYFKI